MAGPGKIKGTLYDMGDYPAAVPAKDETFITGELYQIKNENEFFWAIGQLDDYEGITAEEGETPLYYRAVTDVYISGSIMSAWVYWYNGDVSGRPVIASGDVLEYLKKKQ